MRAARSGTWAGASPAARATPRCSSAGSHRSARLSRPRRLELKPAVSAFARTGGNVKALYMSWSRQTDAGGRRSYHHGNLREALIRAALELIAQKGPAGFTFADAARWAGVSSAAPYRHFRDRDALMADVARRGFDRFAGTLESAWDSGRPDAFAAFDRLGKAYLRFAKSEPAYYSAMFEAGIPPDASPELEKA